MKSNINVEIQLFTIVVYVLATVICQGDNFVGPFSKCHMNDPKFDNCIEGAINASRQYLKTGVPQYGIAPFDPFIIKEVSQNIGVTNLNYKLTLKDVDAKGWATADFKQFRTNFNKHMVQYTQFFPDKKMKGEYEFSASIYGINMHFEGSWSLALADVIETVTVTRKPRQADNGTLLYDTPLKVYVDVGTCKNLKMHISNIFNGNAVLEYALDEIINVIWPIGFVVLRPIFNDVISAAYTDRFNEAFGNFPINEIIH